MEGKESAGAQKEASSEPDNEEEQEDAAQATADTTAAASSLNDDLRAARTIFENILTVSPKHANALYNLALLAETDENNTQAKDYYERLLDTVTDQATKDFILEKLRTL